MTDDLQPIGEFLLYSTAAGQSRVECRFENESIWQSQALMAELYDRSKKTISEHLKNLVEEGELELNSVVRNFQTTANDGISYDVQFSASQTSPKPTRRINQRKPTIQPCGIDPDI